MRLTRFGVQDGAVIGEYILTFDDSRVARRHASIRSTTVPAGPTIPATGSFIVNVAGGPMEIDHRRAGDSRTA